jgi:hypothetical protein
LFHMTFVEVDAGAEAGHGMGENQGFRGRKLWRERA